ncbi:MAG: fibronectin type III-like domain-contianing protein, partial [Bacteroidaceae bacterium]|nr:fibronectin type III-like domain-contianing protein [Bacteroidaceae bacterium]
YMKEEPLFPFGYGLSYTTFKIGAAKLSSNKIGKEDSLTVSFSVHNTGKMDGAEVCQIYLRKEGDETGPLKALRGFKRVELKAGEKKNVSITLGKKELEWWNEEVNCMTIVPGTYHLMLGNSSDSKALKTHKFTITK